MTPDRSRILLVDDVPENLGLLVHALGEEFAVMAARNGNEALDKAQGTPSPDLILLDVEMPGMDGYEVCRRLKEDAATREIPVIFLTAKGSAQDEEQGFAAGGVDYIIKPFQPRLVRTRAATHLALKKAYRELEERNDLLLFEREMVEGIIQQMRADKPLADPRLNAVLTPLEETNGDLVLAARRPDGVLHVLVGDFSGHGLPAALGGPMTADIFHAMTQKGFSYGAILEEIDAKLKRKLPANVFLAAAFVAVEEGAFHLWNGGLPDLIIYRNGRAAHQVSSTHPALGIRGGTPTGFSADVWMREPEDVVFCYSDGVIESKNPAGELFGMNNMDREVSQIIQNNRPIDSLLEVLTRFRDGGAQTDDITMVTIQ